LSAQPALEVVESGEAEVTITALSANVEHISSLAAVGAVLVLGTDDAATMVASLEAGAIGYLPRDSTLDEIARAVEAVAGGEAVVPPLMLGSLLRHVVRRRRTERADLERLLALTDRERQVFDLLAAGLDRGAIAERLFISVGTVRSHLQNLFRKLNVHTHAEAVGLAARCGLVITDIGDDT
jgi:two-component system NarL family response regulator